MQISATLRHCVGHSLGVPKLDIHSDIKKYLESGGEHCECNGGSPRCQLPQVFNLSNYFIGYAILESDVGPIGSHQESSWMLGIGLTPYQLQKIEEIRRSGDLYLVMRFMCRGAEFDRTNSSKSTEFRTIPVETPGYGSPCPFKVAQSDWIKTLKELGYGDYFLIEVPLRGIRARKQMDKALEYISKA